MLKSKESFSSDSAEGSEETDNKIENLEMSESQELLANKEADEDETSETQSEEKEKKDESIEDSKKTSSKPEYGEEQERAMLEFESKILAKHEEELKKLKDFEIVAENRSGLYPCKSCEFLDPLDVVETTCCLGLCKRSFSRYGDVREFWIVSAPGNETPQETFQKLNAVTQSKKLSQNFKFHFPELKINTMDELMTLTDQLRNDDNYIEGVLRKLSAFMSSIISKKKFLLKHLLVNNMDLTTYLKRFTWDVEKYPLTCYLDDILELLLKTVKDVEKELKLWEDEAYNVSKTLYKIKHDREANLLTRPLDKLVKKEDFVNGSEYFQTLLVVVAKEDIKKWIEEYETLTQWVVPQSSARIHTDESHSLFTVVVVKKFADEFRSAARVKKFIVRNFDFSEKKDSSAEDIFVQKLEKVRKALLGSSYRWIKAKFSVIFETWIHTKALRVFTESVLRYGIPINFQATLMIPLNLKKAKKAIDNLYDELECDLAYGNTEDIPGGLAQYGVSKYLPYVFVTISTDFKDVKED